MIESLIAKRGDLWVTPQRWLLGGGGLFSILPSGRSLPTRGGISSHGYIALGATWGQERLFREKRMSRLWQMMQFRGPVRIAGDQRR